jgi:hypothetical protein
MHESWWYANILRALQASVSSALPEVRVPTSKLLRESRIVELMSFCRNAQHTEIPCTEQAVALRIVTLRVINNGALTTCKKKERGAITSIHTTKHLHHTFNMSWEYVSYFFAVVPFFLANKA